jgi:rod shape-determining protein MreD
MGHVFYMLWSGFALSMAIVMISSWTLHSLWIWQKLPFLPVLLQAMLAIVIFPLPAWLLTRLQRNLLTQT